MSRARGLDLQNALAFEVYGTPAPQGSKRAFAVRGKGGAPTGKIAVMEQNHDRIKSWRQAIIDAVRAEFTLDGPLGNPVRLDLAFYLHRPKAHFRTGKNAGILRDDAPMVPGKMPDLSKLIRATEDALTDAGVWDDDGQVAKIVAAKFWDDTRPPGAYIRVQPISAKEASDGH